MKEFLAALIAGILCISGAPVLAADMAKPGCGSFTVYTQPGTIEFIDIGPEGPSTGDQRIGGYVLVDEAGQELGSMDFVTIVLPPSDDGSIKLHSTGHHSFPNGTLAISLIYELPDVTDGTRGTTVELEHIVTGGSGDFAHATGTIHFSTTADGRRQATYDLKCGR